LCIGPLPLYGVTITNPTGEQLNKTLVMAQDAEVAAVRAMGRYNVRTGSAVVHYTAKVERVNKARVRNRVTGKAGTVEYFGKDRRKQEPTVIITH